MGNLVIQKKIQEEPALVQDEALSNFIAAEANLLRLPLFALSTKDMKREGLECKGRSTRDGEDYQWKLTIRRPAGAIWPGPMSRAAHQALLSIIRDTVRKTGQPFENPVVFGWRDLCRRIGIVYSGRTVNLLKGSLKATKGLLIESDCALYSKPLGRPIRKEEAAVNLYDRVSFRQTKYDMVKAETNGVWLSEWYLNNLNAYFTAPLDYNLWRDLDAHSQIASRMYEFLLLNFYRGFPKLSIKYSNLASYLPVKQMAHLSEAQRQFNQPFDLLKDHNIISKVIWQKQDKGAYLLEIFRGTLLPAGSDSQQQVGEIEPIEVKELVNLKPPEHLIVEDFYKLWSNMKFPNPTVKEIEQAKVLLVEHGETKLKGMIPEAIKRLRTAWPECRTFGGLLKYIPEVAQVYEKNKNKEAYLEKERIRQKQEKEEDDKKLQAEQDFKAKWKPVWESLPKVQREGIEREILRIFKEKSGLKPMKCVVDLMCWKEVAKRTEEGTLNTEVTSVINQVAATMQRGLFD